MNSPPFRQSQGLCELGLIAAVLCPFQHCMEISSLNFRDLGNRTQLGILGIFALVVCSSTTVVAEDLDIHIANRGTVPIYVAVVKYGGLLGTSTSDGWYKVDPSRWLEPRIVSGSTWATYYLAFAVMKNGRLGYVRYKPSSGRGAHSTVNTSFVVHPKKAFGYKGNYKSLQRAQGEQVLIPFFGRSAPVIQTDDILLRCGWHRVRQLGWIFTWET